MENNIYPVQIRSEPQIGRGGGMFANKVIGGEESFRGSTDEAGTSGLSFRTEGIDQTNSAQKQFPFIHQK